MSLIERIRDWFAQGSGDFDKGFELLQGTIRNRFYLENVRRRRDLESVKHELNKLYYALGGKKADQFKRVEPVPVTPVPVVVGSPVDVVLKKPVAMVVAPEKEKPMKAEVPAKDKDERVQEKRALPRDERVVLRKEFPFLDASGCPEEFKILVADMITAHGRYVNGHDRLFDVANKDNLVCYKAAREVVESYIDNREMWEELEHYKRTGEVLGRHRIFAERNLRKQIMAMSGEELKKFSANLKRRRAAREKMIAESAGDERIGKWMAAIEEIDRTEKLVASWGVNGLLDRMDLKRKRGKKKKV